MVPSFAASERIVLKELLLFYHDSDVGEWLTVEQIKNVTDVDLSLVMVRKVLGSLVEKRYIDHHRDDQKGSASLFTLTAKGIAAAERAIVKEDVISLEMTTIPASDRVVSLEDNQRVIEAIAAVEEAEEAVRSSNTIDEIQKGWIRQHLQLGTSLIKARQVSWSAIKSLLLSPLQSAWKSVGEEVAKNVIHHAINVVKGLMGWS